MKMGVAALRKRASVGFNVLSFVINGFLLVRGFYWGRISDETSGAVSPTVRGYTGGADGTGLTADQARATLGWATTRRYRAP